MRMRSPKICLLVDNSMAGEHRWIFTREEIANTPSRKCGIDSEKELNYRQQAANLIQDMGQRLQVTQLCINTAIVYMHRFYMFHSFTKFHRNSIASASLFLAAKVEEQPRKLEHVIKVCHMLLNRDQGQLDTQSEQYLQEAQDLVINENIVLQSLGFDITVDHPHGHVVRTCTLVKASKDLAQTSYFLATNSLHLTQMCLMYKPTVVACVCMHLACKWSDYQIPRSSEGKEWFSYVDREVTSDLLEDLTGEFLAILDRCPSKLKKKILTWKAGGREDQQMAGGSPTLGMSVPPPPPPPPPKDQQHKDRHRGQASAAAGSAAAGTSHEHHARSSHEAAKTHASSGGAEGMRRVRTEPIIASNNMGPGGSSITPKEYLQRKDREKVDRSRDRHHHGLPQHPGKHDHPDGRPRHDQHRHGEKPHDPNRNHPHRPPGHPSQHKHGAQPAAGAPDAKVQKMERPPQEQKERSNIFDKMQLESSNASTPEPLFDHLKIKESLDADLMDMSKEATLPSSRDGSKPLSQHEAIQQQKLQHQKERHQRPNPQTQQQHRDRHFEQALVRTPSSKPGAPNQRPSQPKPPSTLTPGSASEKGERSASAAATAIKNQLRSVKPGEGHHRRPHGPQSHRDKHSHHGPHQKRPSSNPISIDTKPISEMTAFEQALLLPNSGKPGESLKSPPSKNDLLSPDKESLSSPTTPKEQRIPVERGMLLSSERKRKRLPSICVEDRELLESRKGSSPKIVLERVESSDSENTSNASGKNLLEDLFSPARSQEIPMPKEEKKDIPPVRREHEKSSHRHDNSSRSDNNLKASTPAAKPNNTPVITPKKTEESKPIKKEHESKPIKREHESKPIKKEPLLLAELKKEVPPDVRKDSGKSHRKEGYPTSSIKKDLLHPVKKESVASNKETAESKPDVEKDKLIKKEFKLDSIPEKIDLPQLKIEVDKKEPGELTPDTPITKDTSVPKMENAGTSKDSSKSSKKNDLIPDMSDLVTENKVTDSPSSGSLKLTFSKSLMNNSPMSESKSSKKDKDRDHHHHHRHKEKKHKRHKEKHKRSRSPGEKSSHKEKDRSKDSDKSAIIPKLKIKIGGHGSGSDTEKAQTSVAGGDEAAKESGEAPVLKVVFSKDKSGHYSSGHHKHKKDKDRDKEKSSRKRHRSPSHKHGENSSNPHKMSRTDSSATATPGTPLSIPSAAGMATGADGLTLEHAQRNISMMIEHLSKQIAVKTDNSPSRPPLPSGEPPPPPPPPVLAPPKPPSQPK